MKKEEMVRYQIHDRGIKDSIVLEAMRNIPREKFVSPAYKDNPLPIGSDQTISQPYIVAYMCEALKLNNNDTVIEIGTGSGYHAAKIYIP